MGELVQFVPRAELTAEANLNEFIQMCKRELTAFGDDWTSDRWKKGKTVAVFSTKTAPSSRSQMTPLAAPFKDFAKAYVRYHYSHRPVQNLQWMMQALRCIEAALLTNCQVADVRRLNGVIMDLAAERCRHYFDNADSRCNTGRHLEKIVSFVRKSCFAPGLPVWRSPFKKPKILTEDLGEDGRRHREAKLPSNESMMLVADLFARADDPESRFYSAIFVLLMAAPSRASEVLALPIDCIQWEDDASGTPQMYLRWRAAKGKGATKKWIVPAMHEAVREAVERLVEIGAPAREAARRAFNDPDQTSSDPAGFRGHGDHWPYIDEEETVEVWNALCIHRRYEFNSARSTQEYSWCLVTVSHVGSRLGGERSLFVTKGMTHTDGSSVSLTTHQFRHWISTMSARAGMDDYTLAQWAGRARVSDNRHYDHRTPGERIETAKQLLQSARPSLLERFRERQPVTYEELGVDRPGTAKATLYGMCVHDYAMAPCMKQRECMTCKEHVCIKGDHVSLDRIKLLEAQTESLLLRAQQAHEDGDFGADRWVDNHKWKLAHVRAHRVMLEDVRIPEGSVITIPPDHDPSPVLRALMDLGLESPSDNVMSPPSPRIIPAVLKAEDA